MRPRSMALACSIAALAAQSAWLASPVLAAGGTEVPFSSTGAEQSWLVPAGVTSIHAVLVGGKGGVGSTGGVSAGGFGDRVEVDLSVTPGTTLYVEVGGTGGANGASPCSVAAAGGFNGGGASGTGTLGPCGGGGGGASDLRTLPRVDGSSLASRLVVAGAGGGGGAVQPTPGQGSPGGAAGLPAPGGSSGGGAGTASAGGAGGTGTGPESNGSLGQGGVGISSTTSSSVGGGGGGGLYGGGGGNGSGGGGGSSAAGAGTNPSIATDTSGIPSITISYGGTPSGTVDATVTMRTSQACLELSTATIDFGTRSFGDVAIPATPDITVTNCSGNPEDVLARGTDATGAGPTTWTLNDAGTCEGGTLPTDNYSLLVAPSGAPAATRLSTSNKMLETLSSGEANVHVAQIDTPCPGSDGAGVVMSMQITFVATEPAP